MICELWNAFSFTQTTSAKNTHKGPESAAVLDEMEQKRIILSDIWKLDCLKKKKKDPFYCIKETRALALRNG